MQVNGLKDKVQGLGKPLNDSLEGDLRDFLINEAELHTYDDLTKVNPVTPSTGTVCVLRHLGTGLCVSDNIGQLTALALF